MTRLVISTLILLFLIVSNINAGIIINEVMANEPSGYVTLEWFELFNDSRGTVSLDNYQIHISDKVIEFESGIELEAGAYQVFCRQLITYGTTHGFEEYWGDNSQEWGDTYQETIITTPIEIEETFILTNASGLIELYDNNEMLISEFEWTSSGLDGYSWERFSPQSDVIEQSMDVIGSSPGYVNSITPVPNDLAVELIDVSGKDGVTSFSLLITNLGINIVTEATLNIFEEVYDDLIYIWDYHFTLPELNPRETYKVERDLELFDTEYTTIFAELSDDDRNNNNTLRFTAPGSDFPPVIINEFLPNPTSSLGSEWIEIYNLTIFPFDLQNWLIGDSLHTYSITDTQLFINPNGYLIITEDSKNFTDYYSYFNGIVIEPSQWPTLNNGTDKVRLIDKFGLELDSYSYNSVFPDNKTWARENDLLHQNVWGYSEKPDGTPGELNQDVYLTPTGTNINITIKPEIFSPDGDYRNESTRITVEAPENHDYKLKIYDKQGREVYSFRNVEDINVWSGVNNGGARLPIGIYIVYFEVVGEGSVKKPVVIAR